MNIEVLITILLHGNKVYWDSTLYGAEYRPPSQQTVSILEHINTKSQKLD